MNEALPVIRGPIDGADCAACPFATDGKPTNPVRGIGPEAPRMIFIGEGPGVQEVRTGMPFVGPTGQLLNRGLQETGTPRVGVYLGNATLCLPSRSDEKTKAAAALACRPRLLRELALFPGKPVLALGGVAAKTLVGSLTKLPITEIAGAHFELDLDGTGLRSVIPTVHPAAILRSSHDKDTGPEKTGSHVADLSFWQLRWDILKVRNLADGKDIRLRMRPGQELFIELEDPVRANALVLERLEAARRVGRLTIDYETYVEDPTRNNALQAFIARIKLVGLAAEGRACSVYWDLLTPETLAAYQAILLDEAVTKAGHNYWGYDQAVHGNAFYSFQEAGPTEDTLYGQHVIWPGAKKKLQHVAGQYRAVEPWKSEYRDSGDSLEDEAWYCAKDAFATDATIAPTKFWVKKNLAEKCYDVDRVKAGLARMMHLRGYYVCPDVNAEIKRRLGVVVAEANRFLDQRYEALKERVHLKLASERAKGKRKADPEAYSDRIKIRLTELAKDLEKGRFHFKASNDWHAVALLKAAGVPLWQTTPGGRVATGGAILEKHSQFPEVDELIRLRSNEQLYETFVVRMYEWVYKESQKKWMPPHVQDDGRVHPLWSPTQISGRFGSKDPASSNWSEGDETHADPRKRLPNIRRQLVAPPGRAIVAFDFEQLEARLMAVHSGDPFLCKVFSDGLDIHFEFGRIVFPRLAGLDKKDPEYTRLRNLAKRFEFGALYGGSDAVVHKSISADEPAMAGPNGLKMTQAAIVKMKQAVGGLLDWQQRLLRETSVPPYTVRDYVLGRRRVFPLGNPSPTDVNNFPNQSTGAAVIDTGLVRFLPRLEKFHNAFGILHQHDAIYFEVDEDQALDVAAAIKAAFTTAITAANGQEILFPVEVKVGFAYHVEPSDALKAKRPELIWPVGRPGLVKVKV